MTATNNQPPQAIEVEESVLSMLLLEPEAMADAKDMLRPKDFYKIGHRYIFQALIDTYAKHGSAYDVSIIAQALKTVGQLDAVGGSYLARLINECPVAANLDSYCTIIKEKAALRQLISLSNKVIAKCHEPGDMDITTLIDKAQASILKIEVHDSGEAVRIGDLLEERIGWYEELYQSQSDITGIPTGYADLDSVLSGLQRSDLIYLAARPGMGKTALALNVMLRMGLKGVPTAMFSFEMSKEQLFNRNMATLTDVNGQKFRDGRFSSDNWQKIMESSGVVEKLPIWIDDTPEVHYAKVRRKARRLKQKGIKALFIDYLQLMSGDRGNSRQDEVSSISRAMKLMAKELDLPVVCLSQLNRDLEKRSDKRPMLSDLRESGSLEQDADVVMFLYRPEEYNKEDPNLKGLAEVIVAKQRNGPTKTIGLHWFSRAGRFENTCMRNYGNEKN